MAGAPKWKVYRNGQYVAACKHPDDAAVLVSASGGEVRADHSPKWTVWREGQEEFSAGESYGRAAEVMLERLQDLKEAAHIKAYGKLPADYKRGQS